MLRSRLVAKQRKRRTGGRSARVLNAVLTAAKATLVRRGFAQFSIAEVAKLSGVHETSIYRRWCTRAALIVETVLTHYERELPIPNTGVLRDDIVWLLRGLLKTLKSRLGITLIRMVAGPEGASQEVKAIRETYWGQRREELKVVFHRGIERGELPRHTDLDLLLDTLIGTFYVRALITTGPLDIHLPEQVTDLVLRGAVHRHRDTRSSLGSSSRPLCGSLP